MTVFQTMRCAQCGSVRAAQTTPFGLCPTCLLASALAMDDEPCPYQVLAPIGAGSSGVTYLAQGLTGVGGYVALKILKPGVDADAVLSRYRSWKGALGRITHPSVAPLLDAGLTADGMVYLASSYVTGWPLTSIDSHASIGRLERVELARQLTGAIDAAHDAGVMHLKLDSSKVKVSNVAGVQATILGLGSYAIVHGVIMADRVAGGPAADRLALANIIRELGVAP
jgi:serine/threonine protein kinase